MKTYGEIISDQVKRGFIERVTESEIPHNCHFIPHHPVKKDSTTTPIRIVYDCSCRQSPSHPSLNDCLQVGPPFMNDLCSLLLRFRTHKDGLTRAAKIRTKHGRTNRPIAKLYPLEVNEDDGGAISQGTANAGDHENSNIEENTPRDNAAHGRPMRSAARKARNRIKGWTDTLAAAPEDVVK